MSHPLNTHPLNTICRKHAVRKTAVRIPARTDGVDWPELGGKRNKAPRHWQVTLTAWGRQLTFQFSQGSAHKSPPTIADMLHCLISDAQGIDDAPTFEDWASEYGLDTDSRKAERSWKLTVRSAKGARCFLGDHFDAFCEAAQDY